MNDYSRDLDFDLILPHLKVMSYKQVLMQFAAQAAKHTNVSQSALFALLMKQERNTSSGVGNGVAIAHLQARGPQKPFTMLATLDHPVDFKAVDDKPVNLACLVFSPESEGPYHLRRLSRISRLLKNDILHKRILEAQDKESIHALLLDPEGWLLAA